MALLEQVNFWHWWILAVALMVLEVLLPGVVFLWLSIAAGAVGLVVLFMPGMTWESQILIFAVLGVMSAVAGRFFYKKDPPETDHPSLNRRGEQHVGKTVILETAMENGKGRTKIGDSTWIVVGKEDLPKGASVRITGVKGTSLTVEKE